MRLWLSAAVIATFAGPVGAASFDPRPWLADLQQTRGALHDKYANWEWVEGEREVKIDALFDDLAVRLRKAPNETAARAVFERFQRKLGDGHVEIEWPTPPRTGGVPAAAPSPDLCADIGYDARQNGKGTAEALPGYLPLASNGNPFDAGTVEPLVEGIRLANDTEDAPGSDPDNLMRSR